jgi:hypothetical protein
LKETPDEGLNAVQLEIAARWRAAIMRIAVFNLLLLLVVALIPFPRRSWRRISNRVTTRPPPVRSTAW